MIYNVIDKRLRPYRWREVNAVIEATSHDNVCDDSDQRPISDDDLIYDQLEAVSVNEALAWAHAQSSAVTLYLYDKGAGI